MYSLQIQSVIFCILQNSHTSSLVSQRDTESIKRHTNLRHVDVIIISYGNVQHICECYCRCKEIACIPGLIRKVKFIRLQLCITSNQIHDQSITDYLQFNIGFQQITLFSRRGRKRLRLFPLATILTYASTSVPRWASALLSCRGAGSKLTIRWVHKKEVKLTHVSSMLKAI